MRRFWSRRSLSIRLRARPSSWNPFRRGKLSIGRACELLGLDRVAFAQRAAALDIPYFQMTKEDWELEKKTIDTWLRS